MGAGKSSLAAASPSGELPKRTLEPSLHATPTTRLTSPTTPGIPEKSSPRAANHPSQAKASALTSGTSPGASATKRPKTPAEGGSPAAPSSPPPPAAGSTAPANGATISPKSKSDKVKVGMGMSAWLTSTILHRRRSKIPLSNFALLARLPVSRAGPLTRVGAWSAFGSAPTELYLVIKSCYALVYYRDEKHAQHGSEFISSEAFETPAIRGRRASLGATPKSDDFEIPDRILVLAGGSAHRHTTNANELQLVCQDGTSLTLKAEDHRSRDAWIAALDRAARQGATRLSDFEAYAKLARGHFGTVQLVKHVRTNTALALKQIAMRPKKPEKQFHERHILEVIQSGSKGPCPFIARLCFAFRDTNSLYLATELASGGDLWALLRKMSRLSESAAKFVTAEVILATQHIHSHGVLHRDIKLENLLLDGLGHVKVVDFGLSKRLFDPASGLWDGRTMTVCGTNYYMPPEMLKRDSPGHGLPTDWWQVGCLAYELVAGSPAFFEKGARAIHKKILDTGGAPGFPRGVEPSVACLDLVNRFLVHDPTRRFGYGSGDGRNDIMTHRFYEGVDWESLAKRRIEVPGEIRAYLRGESAPSGGGSEPHGMKAVHETPEEEEEDATMSRDSPNQGEVFYETKDPDAEFPLRAAMEEEEEDLVQRVFPESEILPRPAAEQRPSYSKSHSSMSRIRSLPLIPRLSGNLFVGGSHPAAATAASPAPVPELGPFLGYEFAIDDAGLGEAKRGSGLILARWVTETSGSST